MLIDLLRYEWTYHRRQVSFIAAVVLYGVFGFLLTASGFGPDSLAVNSPYIVTQSLGFLSLLAVFAIAIFTSNAMLRDAEYRLEEIVFSTPVDRFRYLLSRSVGAFVAGLTALGASAIGMIAATHGPWLAPERVAAFDPVPYLWSFALLVVPNALFVTVLLCAVAALTRKAIATHVAAVFIYVLYFVGAALTNSPLMAGSTPGAESGPMTALLDPFGLSSFFETTRYWTIAQKNAQLIPLAGALLFNRVVWITASIAIWAVGFRLFSFRVLRKSRKKRSRAATRAESGSSIEAAPYAPVSPALPSARRWLATYVQATRAETRAIVWNVPFLLMLALWIALAGSEVYSSVFDGEYGTISYPATVLVVGALRQPLGIMGMLLLLYYGAEVFWREHRLRFSSIVDTTPIPSSIVVVAKWSALVLLALCLATSGAAIGIAIQLSSGYTNLEPWVYLSYVAVAMVPLALYAAATIFLHAISPGKYAGMVLVLVFLLFALRAGMLGLEHPMWRFASAPPVRFTDMNGLAGDVQPFVWFMLFWTIVSALLVLMAAGIWRNVGAGVVERMRLLVRRSSPAGRSVCAALLVLTVVTGGWVLFNTNVLNANTTTAEMLDWRADYERTYADVRAMPQPTIAAVDVRLDFFPDERRYHLGGRYAVVNSTSEPIGTVFVSVRREARLDNIAMAAGRLAASDTQFGTYRFELDAPLAPGARTNVEFDLEFASRGFGARAPDASVVENGSLVMSYSSFPTIGYSRANEISDPDERARRGLAGGGVERLDAEANHGDAESASAEWVDFSAVVSTAADQTAIAPGRLDESWEQDGRRYFRYTSDAPMLNRFAFASARYEVASRRHGDVDIEVYYHPGHAMNVERMLDASADALDVLQESFGAYPYRQLRIAEVPPYRRFGAFAMPGVIFVQEDRGFLIDARDPDRLDLVTRRVAHEVAHQWWGHGLLPARAEGATFLVESLTKYSELLVMERRYGRAYVRRMLAIEMDRYLSGRSREEQSEVPLYRTGGQSYLYYGKGAIVTWAIRDLVGDDRVRTALQGLYAEHAGPAGTATTLDVLAHLRRVTTAEQFATIEEWMKEIVLYDLAIDGSSVRQLDDGRYEVTVRIAASKLVADGAGNEQGRDLNESIDVALFDSHPENARSDDAMLAIQKVTLRSGATEAVFKVDRKPAYVAVDPNLTRMDRNRLNNVASVD